jgi:hypothetical protein
VTPSTEDLVDQYRQELRRAAGRLPRRERDELVAEIEAHLRAGLEDADTVADVHNLLEGLGDPAEIVAAASPEPARPPRRGSVALALGLVGAVLGLIPFLGLFVAIPLGVAAIVIGSKIRREARALGEADPSAAAAIIAGVVAVVVPLLLLALFLPQDTRVDVELETEELDVPAPPEPPEPPD